MRVLARYSMTSSLVCREQHAPGLIQGLLADGFGLLAHDANRRRGVVHARFREKAGHFLADQQPCSTRGEFALLPVLVHQLLQIVDRKKITSSKSATRARCCAAPPCRP